MTKPLPLSRQKFEVDQAVDLPWRQSTGPLSCLVKWGEMLNVSATMINAGEVTGLLVMFRNIDVTSQFTERERMALELVLIENFHAGVKP